MNRLTELDGFDVFAMWAIGDALMKFCRAVLSASGASMLSPVCWPR